MSFESHKNLAGKFWDIFHIYMLWNNEFAICLTDLLTSLTLMWLQTRMIFFLPFQPREEILQKSKPAVYHNESRYKISSEVT